MILLADCSCKPGVPQNKRWALRRGLVASRRARQDGDTDTLGARLDHGLRQELPPLSSAFSQVGTPTTPLCPRKCVLLQNHRHRRDSWAAGLRARPLGQDGLHGGAHDQHWPRAPPPEVLLHSLRSLPSPLPRRPRTLTPVPGGLGSSWLQLCRLFFLWQTKSLV